MKNCNIVHPAGIIYSSSIGLILSYMGLLMPVHPNLLCCATFLYHSGLAQIVFALLGRALLDLCCCSRRHD
ncbi:hypothetical protein NEOLEDRAFT_972881 [Neolentinus lepideus HHB14362 ss-1]|uniref:Uncharacterized protein n=1 Tax=Neolentinus lepideus HHB14362 ss-1 TaxID=1314782 RepID=A0A165N9Z6_9AGAM|nr:hypothetical protein NEOLEDRAFT_972881 [Neolentinus lepideus HHB14362 ss-1]